MKKFSEQKHSLFSIGTTGIVVSPTLYLQEGQYRGLEYITQNVSISEFLGPFHPSLILPRLRLYYYCMSVTCADNNKQIEAMEGLEFIVLYM